LPPLGCHPAARCERVAAGRPQPAGTAARGVSPGAASLAPVMQEGSAEIIEPRWP
jgi:hypothetical protein